MPDANPLPVSSAAARLFEEICDAIPVLGLVSGEARVASRTIEAISSVSAAELLGIEATGSNDTDRVMADCVRAGLLLRADLFEPSHEISQNIGAAEGSYWHGILHRREPDFGNSKYWFHRTGSHAVFAELSLESVGGSTWDPFEFIDLCEACVRGERPELREPLQDLQEQEIRALLRHCAAAAAG